MIASGFSEAYSQNNCKVLKPGIDSTYTGDCKQGLANGQGTASGVDRYTGEFKKGLPDGTGTYIWINGDKYEGQWKKGLREGSGKYTTAYNGRDSVITGIWQSDKYIGEESIKPYVILFRNGVTRVSCIRTGDQPLRVSYKFTRGGTSSEHTSPISNLLLQGSSGGESSSSSSALAMAATWIRRSCTAAPGSAGPLQKSSAAPWQVPAASSASLASMTG